MKKAIEESREEKELEMMGKFDKRDHVVMAEDDVEATPQAPVEETPLAPMAIAVPSNPEGAGAEPSLVPQMSRAPHLNNQNLIHCHRGAPNFHNSAFQPFHFWVQLAHLPALHQMSHVHHQRGVDPQTRAACQRKPERFQ